MPSIAWSRPFTPRQEVSLAYAFLIRGGVGAFFLLMALPAQGRTILDTPSAEQTSLGILAFFVVLTWGLITVRHILKRPRKKYYYQTRRTRLRRKH